MYSNQDQYLEIRAQLAQLRRSGTFPKEKSPISKQITNVPSSSSLPTWSDEGKRPSKYRLTLHKAFKFWAPDTVILPTQVAKILEPGNGLSGTLVPIFLRGYCCLPRALNIFPKKWPSPLTWAVTWPLAIPNNQQSVKSLQNL